MKREPAQPGPDEVNIHQDRVVTTQYIGVYVACVNHYQHLCNVNFVVKLCCTYLYTTNDP